MHKPREPRYFEVVEVNNGVVVHWSKYPMREETALVLRMFLRHLNLILVEVEQQ
jgi:hypothetical protein